MIVDHAVRVSVKGLKGFSVKDVMDQALSGGAIRQQDLLESPPQYTDLQIQRSSMKQPKIGAVKMTRMGMLPTPLTSGSFASVCNVAVKQAYDRKYTSQTEFKPIPIRGAVQLQKLMSELTCMGWANALYDSTMVHIVRVVDHKGPPPFRVPKMRFVASALAQTAEDGDSFMLEECIDGERGGQFVKYIHNASAQVLKDKLPSPEYIMRGEFLSFVQHHQYWDT